MTANTHHLQRIIARAREQLDAPAALHRLPAAAHTAVVGDPASGLLIELTAMANPDDGDAFVLHRRITSEGTSSGQLTRHASLDDAASTILALALRHGGILGENAAGVLCQPVLPTLARQALAASAATNQAA
jgi:hypothetical protein